MKRQAQASEVPQNVTPATAHLTVSSSEAPGTDLASAFRVRRPSQRGFTLVELITVVVIVGVLAMLAVYGVRRYVNNARSSEVGSIMNSVSSHQEAYRDETFNYLDVSTTIDTYYPQTAPGKFKADWTNDAHTDAVRWRAIGVTTNAPVMYGYASKAGAAGTTPPALGVTKTWTFVAGGPWFAVKAVGDVDGNGTYSKFIATSYTSELYAENEAE